MNTDRTGAIYEYGKEILTDEIRGKRMIFNIADIIQDGMTHDEIYVILFDQLKARGFDTSRYDIVQMFKEKKVGDAMSWHIDDRNIIRGKPKYTDHRHTKINNKTYLFLNTEKPLYTCLLYLSDSDEFDGGILRFTDIDHRVSKYDVVFFDSIEMHCLTPITRGIRRNLFVKFYEKKE